jgi:hypothetical protein
MIVSYICATSISRDSTIVRIESVWCAMEYMGVVLFSSFFVEVTEDEVDEKGAMI